MWIFLKTLDQTNCQGGGKRLTGSVMFDENDPIETGVQIWPLEAGSYQAFILRDVSPPYPVVASSGIITITGAPNSPTMTPTRNPTSSPSEKATVPTRAPTGSPTSPMNSPTKAPSHAPTPDGPSLTLISTPYTAGDDIVVDFVYPGNPGGGAWLSLWPADSDPNSLPSPSPYWNYICSDSQSSTCGIHPTSGRVTLNGDSAGSGTWPILCGSWKAYLIADATNYPYYSSIAESESFEIGSSTLCANPVCNAQSQEENPDNTHLVRLYFGPIWLCRLYIPHQVFAIYHLTASNGWSLHQ